MDFAYYTHIPDSEAPTAEIAASSTKHARTTYLDYLSRNGLISWRDRQSLRPLIKVSRMQPGEIQTQIKLDYDQRSEAPVQEVELPQEALQEVEEGSERFRGARMTDRFGEYPLEDYPGTAERYSRSSGEEVGPGLPAGPGGPEDELFVARAAPPVQPKVQSPYAPPGGERVGTRPRQPAPPSAVPDSPIARLSRRSKGA